jgi:prepilin-type N-terminal cleavage/methylation domain-containing protein
MKTNINKSQVDFENQGSRLASTQNSKFKIQNRPAFTLIELLVVISIIAILAGFTIPVLKSVKRTEFINKTKAEMAQLETAIDSYKATYGSYPPSNPNYPAIPSQAMFSPLYFELLGTTNNTGAGTYYTLDGSANISDSTATMINAYGVSGFINCIKPGTGEDAVAAKNFLPDLKPNQIGLVSNNNALATVLLGSVGGPDPSTIYNPFYPSPGPAGVNPWRYVCPGTKNPSSYDLWINLSIAGTTNLVCNWSQQVQKNTTLP